MVCAIGDPIAKAAFFLESLNANFFKLKHLVEYLDEQITRLSSLEDSRDTLAMLAEVKTLMSSSSTHQLFQSLVKESTDSKKRSIHFSLPLSEKV